MQNGKKMKDKLFEEWAKNHKYKTNIENGFYINTHTQSAWEAWKESAPRKLMPTIVKDEQGKVVAVTLTNEEHQVQEVLWQAPRELSDEEIVSEWIACNRNFYVFARAILKKASEK